MTEVFQTLDYFCHDQLDFQFQLSFVSWLNILLLSLNVNVTII